MVDPQFTRELEYRKSQSQPPVETEVRVLLRRKRPNYLKLGIKRSLVLHGSLVAIYGLSIGMQYLGVQIPSFFMNKKDISAELNKKSIRVDVVDLPTLKLNELAKVDLTKEAKVAPEKPKEDTAKAEAEAQAKKDQMVLEQKEAAKKKAEDAKKLAEQKKKAKKDKADADELKQLEDLQKSLSQNYLKDESLKETPTGEDGRAVLAGNIKSEGYSTTGDIATQRDAFQAHVRTHFNKFWSAPGWMKASGKFSARILVRIAPDGRVLSQEFLVRSGSSEYDTLAAKAVADASPFPKPPADLVRNVMEDGIVCGFPE
ncbi:MAG TPA: cell envelope integrity protein TolA [Bdellovibrionota bacterium]|jgi:TonB family protein|nr:cell envelope integrity protein TolA [Bdellovibrionota bacterium]